MTVRGRIPAFSLLVNQESAPKKVKPILGGTSSKIEKMYGIFTDQPIALTYFSNKLGVHVRGGLKAKARMQIQGDLFCDSCEY